MLQIDKVSKKPYYVQVYEYFKAEIESGRMRAGTKLPSIRALAMIVGISKLTVERAYFQLSNEGYIQRLGDFRCARWRRNVVFYTILRVVMPGRKGFP